MKWLGIITVLVIAIATTVFYSSNKAYTHRYKLTVSVEDNGVERTGSSVIEVSWIQQSQNLPIALPQFIANVRGDATVVALNDGRALVALLSPAEEKKLGPEFRVWAASGLPDGNSSIPEIQRRTGLYQLEGSNIPDFVMFEDVTNAGSARLVRPDGNKRELTRGLRLLAATVQIASDPVTRDIEKGLPWWSKEGRPVLYVWRALLMQGASLRSSIEPETLFRRG